jgi:hypothetical protein
MASTGKKFGALALALGLLLAGRAGAVFNITGKVFTAEGLSGTASDSPSFASLAAYRWDIAGNIGIQNGLPPAPQINPAVISPANSAYFASDVDTTGQWASPAAAEGQTLVAVAETFFNQFSWAGESYVYFQKKIVTSTDYGFSTAIFGSRRQRALPALSITQASSAQISLSWTALADSSAIISSYTIYRATYLPDETNRTYGTNEILDNVPAPLSGSVEADYVDNTVVLGKTYYYTLAVNFVWQGVASSLAGARPAQPFYTTFGQSLTCSAKAEDKTPTITQTVTPSGTPTATPTDSTSATATPTDSPQVTETFTPTETLRDSQTPTPTDTPVATLTATPTETELVTETPTPTVSTTATGSATPSSSPSNTLTASTTVTPSASPSLTASPSDSPTWTPSASQVSSPSITATETEAATETATPTETEVATETATPTAVPLILTSTPPPLAYAGKEALAPVPGKAGEAICFYTPRTLERTRWAIYDLSGSLISRFEDASALPCWQVPLRLSGVFLARLEIDYAGGEKSSKVFKIAVLP